MAVAVVAVTGTDMEIPHMAEATLTPMDIRMGMQKPTSLDIVDKFSRIALDCVERLRDRLALAFELGPNLSTLR